MARFGVGQAEIQKGVGQAEIQKEATVGAERWVREPARLAWEATDTGKAYTSQTVSIASSVFSASSPCAGEYSCDM